MYLARDLHKNWLHLYSNKPHRDGNFWVSNGQFITLDSNLYPEVTWEGGPVKVELNMVPEEESEALKKLKGVLKEVLKPQ